MKTEALDEVKREIGGVRQLLDSIEKTLHDKLTTWHRSRSGELEAQKKEIQSALGTLMQAALVSSSLITEGNHTELVNSKPWILRNLDSLHAPTINPSEARDKEFKVVTSAVKEELKKLIPTGPLFTAPSAPTGIPIIRFSIAAPTAYRYSAVKDVKEFAPENFQDVSSVAVTEGGYTLAVDTGSNKIHRIGNGSVLVASVDNCGPKGEEGLLQPTGIFAMNQEIFIADGGNKRVLVIAASNFKHRKAIKSLSRPAGVAVFPDGRLVIADSGKRQVWIISKDPGSRNIIKKSPLFADDDKPYGVGVLSTGSIIVSAVKGRLYKLDSLAMEKPPKVLVTEGILKDPRHLTVDKEDNILVCDAGNKRIVVFDENGKQLGTFGEDKLLFPVGIAIDHNGNVVVTDNKHKIITFVF